MSALKQHAEKLVFLVVLIACAGLLVVNSLQTSEPAEIETLEANGRILTEKLKMCEVSKTYRFSADESAKLAKARQAYEASIGRAEVDPAALPAFNVYPRPAKPLVDMATKPAAEGQRTEEVCAVLGEPSELTARPDHGRIYLSYKLPQMKLMEAVRVEIFRGEAAEKIDLKTPYRVQDFGPEEVEALAPLAAPPAAPAPVPAPVKTNESTGAERRRMREEPKDAKPAAPAAAPAEIPAELQDVRVFADTNVDPKRPYFYKVRLVGRMLKVPNSKEVEKVGPGQTAKTFVYRAPKDGTPIATKSGLTNLLFASPLSKDASATPPSNFEIRLAGIDETAGPVPPPDTPEWRLRDFTSYKGTFAVRIWIKEAQKWEEMTMTLGPGERLKGLLAYKPVDSRETKTYPFDSEYTLLQIKRVNEPHERVTRISKVNAVSNKVEIEERKEQYTLLNEVAFLEYGPTKKIEEYSKCADFQKRDKYLKWIEKLADLHEQESKAQKDKNAQKQQRPSGPPPGPVLPPGVPGTPPRQPAPQPPPHMPVIVPPAPAR